MKKIVLGLLAVMAAAGCAASGAALHFTKPALSESEAVKVTNGTLAATVYGAFPDERIDLPFATLRIRHSMPVKSKIKSYERGLDSASVAFTRLELPQGTRSQELFASAPDSVVVIRYTGSLPLDCNLSLVSDLPHEVKSFDDRITLTGSTPKSYFTTILKVIPGKGNITTNPDGSLTLNYMQGASLLITTVLSPRSARSGSEAADRSDADLARLRIFRASFRGVDRLLAERNKDTSDGYPLTPGASSPTDASDSAADDFERYMLIAEGDTTGTDRMLMKSVPGRITLLPVPPREWKEGEVAGLRAVGGFDVSFRWEKGKVCGGSITYAPVSDFSGEPAKVDLYVNGQLEHLTLKPGESVPLENFVELTRPFIQ